MHPASPWCHGNQSSAVYAPTADGMLQNDAAIRWLTSEPAIVHRDLRKAAEKVQQRWLGAMLKLSAGKRIAVVGSSGNLLRQRRGAEIDEHTVVIRVNGAVTRSYERDVGHRTTIRVAWDRGIVDMHERQLLAPDLFILRVVPFLTVGQPCRTLRSVVVAARLARAANARVNAGARAQAAAQPLTPWEAKALATRPRVRALLRLRGQWVDELGGGEKMLRCDCHTPSTGFVAIAFAVALSRVLGSAPPNLFGFGRSERCYKYYDCDGRSTTDPNTFNASLREAAARGSDTCADIGVGHAFGREATLRRRWARAGLLNIVGRRLTTSTSTSAGIRAPAAAAR